MAFWVWVWGVFGKEKGEGEGKKEGAKGKNMEWHIVILPKAISIFPRRNEFQVHNSMAGAEEPAHHEWLSFSFLSQHLLRFRQPKRVFPIVGEEAAFIVCHLHQRPPTSLSFPSLLPALLFLQAESILLHSLLIF